MLNNSHRLLPHLSVILIQNTIHCTNTHFTLVDYIDSFCRFAVLIIFRYAVHKLAASVRPAACV